MSLLILSYLIQCVTEVGKLYNRVPFRVSDVFRFHSVLAISITSLSLVRVYVFRFDRRFTIR